MYDNSSGGSSVRQKQLFSGLLLYAMKGRNAPIMHK
jgi:hypothetical protein